MHQINQTKEIILKQELTFLFNGRALNLGAATVTRSASATFLGLQNTFIS